MAFTELKSPVAAVEASSPYSANPPPRPRSQPSPGDIQDSPNAKPISFEDHRRARMERMCDRLQSSSSRGDTSRARLAHHALIWSFKRPECQPVQGDEFPALSSCSKKLPRR